ncbi:hypothetical protein ASE36_08730 [Rhizobium sp. Root274]|uniref:hypothetical protein n=1 Tax=unclassified Rhizobium TaxID=2613769 RepID=UPI00071413D2|nr:MULTISPECIES: hypothetical protein [unclassified Rhizobium]KQW28581.1 hypothetical protein ASC71_08740 [Rhizobium sp. Root1240]KRD28782.1 hypothetical protein ASE36_08730 [Rhizobium sp. Root274]
MKRFPLLARGIIPRLRFSTMAINQFQDFGPNWGGLQADYVKDCANYVIEISHIHALRACLHRKMRHAFAIFAVAKRAGF